MLAAAVAVLLAVAPQEPPPPPLPSPAPPPADTPRVQDAALRVFLDCQICDDEYLRTEITFVNYVRDRADAQVHVLVTHQHTGSGGVELTFAFLGLREFAGRGDTLRLATPATATEDEERRAVARVLRLGLMRFVALTPAAEHIEIRYAAPPAAAGARAQPRDPWKFWVFELGSSGSFEGEESYHARRLEFSVEANRVAERSRTEINIETNNRRTEYQLAADSTFVSRRHSYGGEALVVRGFDQHWSLGVYGSLENDSYRNLRLRGTGAGAVEYSVFPYRESTRRKLQLRWGLGGETTRYDEVTIYGLSRETRPLHIVEAEYAVTQPWGQVSLESSFHQYLHNARRLNLQTFGELEVRVLRGLSLEAWGNYRVIRDQLYLAAGGDSPEEIIARQRQQATGYQFEVGLGLSYKFGALYNNIVNPRFGN